MEEVTQAANIWSALPTIISAICTLAAAWFAYNQYTKNKSTDAKIEQWKKEEEKKSAEKSYNITIIFGELWQLLGNLQADRVYIVQPHPLSKNLYLTIQLEVCRQGVSRLKQSVQGVPIAEVPGIAKALVSREFVYYDDILSQMKDRRAAGILNANGTNMVVARRLADDRHEWIGTLICDYNHKSEISPATFRSSLELAASKIQYILPEVKEKD